MQITWEITEKDRNIREENCAFVPDRDSENQVVNLYPLKTYQTMEGFGGAITDSAGYVFSQMSKEQQEEVLDTYFSPEQMNYQQVRIPMDSCDFSTHLYAADDDEADEELAHFSLEDIEKYIFPLLDAAQEVHGAPLRILLSAWSPPAYMKTNGERCNGGKLKEEYYGRWARYLCRYIWEFLGRGYDVERMTIQNEAHAVQTWDSCVYTGEEERTFLKEYLAPELEKEGLSDIEVFIWDHNKERAYERAVEVFDEETAPLAAGVAFHWYSGDHFEALDLIREQFPDKKLILSENCLETEDFQSGADAQNCINLAHDMIGNLNHGMCAFYDWNLLLDEQGGPNHVGNFCDAAFLYDARTGTLTRRRVLDVDWHFSHYIKPGAVRIATTKYTRNIDVTAWKNPDGTLALVLANLSDEEQQIIFRMEGQESDLTLPPMSLASGILQGSVG